MSQIISEINEYTLEESKKIHDGFVSNPNTLLKDYRIEAESIKGYKGREILELLQNAEDALLKDIQANIYIELTDSTLRFCNNGTPFSKNGVRSLLYSHLSAKKKEESIGNKGTGFRALLNWASEIRIYSGELSIAFNKNYAEEKLIELKNNHIALRNAIEEYERDFSKISLATLVTPKVIPPVDKKEYDTIIEVDIKPHIRSEISEQLASITDTTLLFLPKVKKIEILEDGNSRIFTKRQKNKNEVIIDIEEDNTKKHKTWYMATYCDFLYITNDEGEEEKRKYSVSVALPREKTSVEDDSYLYSYFKTKIELPFNALLHGTFDLDANRNQLTNEEHNTTIFIAACKLLIDTTIECYKNDEADYAILENLLLSKSFSYLIPNIHKVLKFYYDTIAEQEIFPTVNHEYISLYNNAKFYDNHFIRQLKGEIFKTLLLRTKSEKINSFICNIAKTLSIPIKYKTGEFEEKINSILHTFTYRDRALLCWHCSSCDEIEIKSINFILDTEGDFIGNSKIFFPNTNSSNISLPNGFSSIRFVNSKIYEGFLEFIREFNIEMNALHAMLMKAFDILEYDLESIIEIVIKEYGTKKNNKIEYSKDIINWLFTNHLKSKLSAEIIKYCKENLELPTRNKGLDEGENLFFASEYGNILIEKLIPNREDLFILGGDFFNIPPEKNEQFISLLKSFGVCFLPRKIIYTDDDYSNNSYKQLLKDSLNYPLIADGCSYSANEFIYINGIIVDSFELIDEILSYAETKYIIEWITNDSELKKSIFSETVKGKFGVQNSSQRSYRQARCDVASYVRYKFMTIPWVEYNGARYSIEDCFFKHSIGSRLEPHLIEPNFKNYNEEISPKVEKELKELFRNIGVAQSFGKLKVDKVYEILNSLSENRKDKSGKLSKIIYKEICTREFNQKVEKVDFPFNVNHSEFCSSGKVFCKDGVFRNIHEVNYLRKPLPKSIEKKFNLIDIEYGKDPNLIEKTLNVSLLEVDTKLISYKEHSLHKNFLKDFYEYKKLAFCYTINKKDDAQELEEIYEKIKKLKLILCSSIKVEFDKNLAELDENNFYFENGVFYLKAPSFALIKELQNIDFSSAIAEIFDTIVDGGGIAKYRELYASHERKRLIALTGESLYEESRQYFDGDKEDKELFFGDCMCYNPSDPILLKEHIENIDFADINSKKNFKTIKLIFELINLNNIDEFNKKSTFDIDLTVHYEEELYALMGKYKKDFINLRFEEFSSKSESEQIKFNEEILYYTERIYKAKNLANYFPEIEFEKLWGKIPSSNLDIKNIWKTNYNNLIKGKDKNILDALLEEEKYNSLLFFDRTELIIKEYNKKIQEKIESENVTITDEDEIEIPIEPLTIIPITPTAPKEIASDIATQRTSRGFKNVASDKEKSEQGKKAEEMVYNSLQEKVESGEISQLEWASENGYLSGNSAGLAGLGYDISYLENSTGVKKYIEVKSTKKTSLSFIITQNELAFAEKHAKDYIIYLITNMGGTKETRILESLFVYNDGESCNKNSKFLLKEKDFEIFIEEQVSC